VLNVWCKERGYSSEAPVGAGPCLQLLFEDDDAVERGGGEYLMTARKVAILSAETKTKVDALREEHARNGSGGSETFVAAQVYAKRVWDAGRPLLIIGPPGTGKTKTTYDCMKGLPAERNTLLGNTWQQVNLLKAGLARDGAAAFATRGVLTRAAGLHTGFDDNPNLEKQMRTLTRNAKKVYGGDRVSLRFEIVRGM
jgi:hypothetical protein